MLLLNENKLEDMSKTLEHYMKLVPSFSAEGKYTLSNGEVISFDDTRFWEVLFGGDQLTVARTRGTQALRDTEETALNRLQGIVPIVEDWHTRMIFLKVYTFVLALDICICTKLLYHWEDIHNF